MGFALLGLVIAGAVYAYSTFRAYTKPESGLQNVVDIASVIVCPPTLLFATCLDCEWIGWGGFVMFSIVAPLNTLLYAGLGAAIASRKKRKGS